MMGLSEQDDAEFSAVWKIIRVIMDMPDTDIAFSAMLAVARAVLIMEKERGKGREAKWSARAMSLTPRVLQLLRRVLKGELRAN
jgi:hypothetical protein